MFVLPELAVLDHFVELRPCQFQLDSAVTALTCLDGPVLAMSQTFLAGTHCDAEERKSLMLGRASCNDFAVGVAVATPRLVLALTGPVRRLSQFVMAGGDTLAVSLHEMLHSLVVRDLYRLVWVLRVHQLSHRY